MISTITHKIMKPFLIATLLCIISGSQVSAGGDLSMLINLKGSWSFSIGINDEWSSPKFNDSNWESIKVPSSWEDQGFNGYNGYAFYRKKVNIPSTLKGRMLYLYLGYVDDVDEAYFNGHKIGSSGGFPPHYSTAYNAERKYYIPEQFINFDGENVIAVKVYDTEQAGGIVSGEIGVYGGKPAVKMDVNLQTGWKFRTGDDMNRKNAAFDDTNWDEVMVPARWEDQGYRNYDGYGWYRKTFIYQGTAEDDRMVLLLGKIDDVDQVYINGTLVGSTGNFPGRDHGYTGTAYNAFRGYYLPAGLLKKGQKITIAVRVLDTGGEGGIYEGPVGLISQTRYIEYWRNVKKTR